VCRQGGVLGDPHLPHGVTGESRVAGEEALLSRGLLAEGLAGVADWEIYGRVILTALVLAGAFVARWVAVRAVRRRFGTAGASGGGGLAEAARDDRHSAYWLRKVTGYVIWSAAAVLLFLVWTEFGRRAGFVVGLFSAGAAFAMQNVLSSFAAWVGILAGKVFRVGDRVMMGGVRGDVIDVSPLRTTIMEIGSPGAAEGSDVWVRARQYTGRVVTVSNKAFFDEPIYNYSKDFGYIWEEITVPLAYTTGWQRGRDILLEEVEEATRPFRESSAEALSEMAGRYLVHESEMDPQVFLELTDNWVELSVRFVIPVRAARALKSGVSERLLRRYGEEGITIASETSQVVGFPPIRVEGLSELLGTYRGETSGGGADGGHGALP
jgi:small-conductance mechanosensitive channel